MTKLTLADLETRQTPQKLLLALKRIQELERTLEQSQNSPLIDELRQRLADSEEEVNALRQQLLALKKRCEDENIPKLQAENTHLKTTLNDVELHSRQLERVIHFLREKAEESFREAQQLREEFEHRHEENASLANSQQKILQQVAVLEEQLSAERTANNELLQKLSELQQQYALTQEMRDVTKASREEYEENARVAQQHLARKMKEIANLLEQIDTQKFQMMDLRHALNDAQQQSVMIKQTLELQLQQERHLHEQLEQRVLLAESQAKKWEEQYNTLYNNWQEGDAEKRSLKGIEERYRQLQGLFMNAQHLLDLQNPISSASNKTPTPSRYRTTSFE